MEKPNITLMICIVLLTCIMLIAILVPDTPVKLITVAICYVLWFITGYIQGKGHK